MKRHGNLWASIVSLDNLSLAYSRARRGKAWQYAVKATQKNLDRRLEALHHDLISRSFTTSPYKEKLIYEPKRRTIYSLPFYPDRIVHHALMNTIEPIWDRLFIYDSYSCRTGKGIHAGSRRTMQAIRRNRYCLKCDISKFYPSIDHDILFSLVQRKIKCRDTLWLLENIIYSVPGGKNVPIGNYTSQWLGNLYLHELDVLIKHDLKVRDYVRYCDDFCLFSNDLDAIHTWRGQIDEFLTSKLLLTFSKCDIFRTSQGVDFLGYRHFPQYILLRKSTATRIKRRLRRLPGMLAGGRITADQVRSSLASMWGWLKWANAHNLTMHIELDAMRAAHEAV